MAGRYGLQIRRASSADAGGITELMATAGHVVSMPALSTRLETLSRGTGVVLLALEWGPPSGLIVVNWFDTLAAERPTAHITMLLVGADHRRRGIGRLLLKAGAQAARVAGCGMLHLQAADADSGLREFCEATGFAADVALYRRPLRKKV